MRRWIRWRKLPCELFNGSVRRVHVVLFSWRVPQIRGRRRRRHLRAASLDRVRGRDDRRDRRRRRLHDGWLGVHGVRVVLPFPQLAADKANRDHRPVAPDHLSFVSQVQLREFNTRRTQLYGFKLSGNREPVTHRIKTKHWKQSLFSLFLSFWLSLALSTYLPIPFLFLSLSLSLSLPLRVPFFLSLSLFLSLAHFIASNPTDEIFFRFSQVATTD